MTELNATQAAARGLLMRLGGGSRVTQVVTLMVRMDLADAIGDGESDLDELSRSYEIAPELLNRLLRALTSLGLCVESAPGKFALTDAGALLRRKHPDSQYEFLRFHTSPVTLQPWTLLEHSIRTGRPAFDETFGMPIYPYFANNPELSAQFNAAMHEESRTAADAVAEHYDFSPFSMVTDIGGGDGTLITAILKRNPGLGGVVFDTPEGAAQTADRVRAAGLDGRCTIATGDFFDTIPAGSDLYLLKSTVHNWNDERATTILRNCRTAMSNNARLLIIDTVLPDTATLDSAELNPYLKDLQMLVLVGGQERTRAEFDQLCTQAGLTITDVVPLPPRIGLSIIEIARA